MTRGKKRRKERRPPKKFSAIFIEYAAPLLELAEGLDEFCKAVDVAKLGWNMGALDQAGHLPFEDAIAELKAGPDSDEAAAILEMLVERRQDEFGRYDWVIDVAQVRDEGDEWIVRVEIKEFRE